MNLYVKMKNLNETFCVLPWIHSFVNSNGNYLICCSSEEFHSGILNEKGGFYNIGTSPSIEEIMNSQFMKDIRKKLLDGHWPEECKRCMQTEFNKGISRRIIENNSRADSIQTLIENTAPDGAININIKSADYRLGNFCNLECRMCSPYSSNKWIKNWNLVKTKDEHISESKLIELGSYDWIKTEVLINEFSAKLSTLDHLHFAGGEPLISPKMEEMLKICIARRFSHKITLTYNTNLTKLPPKILELWKHFKGVRLLCSVDGIGKMNEYIRFPSIWSEVEKNLNFLDNNFKKFKIEQVLLSTTVQIYNIQHLPQIYKFLASFHNIVKAPNLINLYYPSYLQSSLIPEQIKPRIEKELIATANELKDKLNPEDQYLIENIFQIINFMKKEISDVKSIEKFIFVNSNIDKIKGIFLHEHIPELHNVLFNQL